MSGKKFLVHSIFPLMGIGLLLLLGQYIYMVDGQIDFFRFCIGSTSKKWTRGNKNDIIK